MGNCGSQAKKQRTLSQYSQTPQSRRNSILTNVNNPNLYQNYISNQNNLLDDQLTILSKNQEVFVPLMNKFKFKEVKDIRSFSYQKLENIQQYLIDKNHLNESIIFGKKALARKIRNLGKNSIENSENHVKLSQTYQKLGATELAVKHLLQALQLKIMIQKPDLTDQVAIQLEDILVKNKFMVQTDRDSSSTLHSFPRTTSPANISRLSPQSKLQLENNVTVKKEKQICNLCQNTKIPSYQQRLSIHSNNGIKELSPEKQGTNNNIKFRYSQVKTGTSLHTTNNLQKVENKQLNSNRNNNNLFQLSCKHVFHFQCFIVNIGDDLECPTCKQNLKPNENTNNINNLNNNSANQ